MTFGEKIQKLRKEAGLSQEEFSYQLGVSRQAVSKWERDNGYPEKASSRSNKISSICSRPIESHLQKPMAFLWESPAVRLCGQQCRLLKNQKIKEKIL